MFFPLLTTTLLSLTPLGAFAAPAATISGPYTELRLAPIFDAKTQTLTKNWGATLPVGTPFRVEKIYGRWLYGTPEPRVGMSTKEHAKPGWIFSRMLLLGNDKDTLSAPLIKQTQAVIFHSRKAARKVDLSMPSLDFLESLTLSRGTLNAFIGQDETALSSYFQRVPTFFPLALAEEAELPPSMGLSGTDLGFLDQEFSIIQEKKKAEEKKRLARKLRPPMMPPIDPSIRNAILGRFMMKKYLEMPPLTHEEVDGYIYMRATALRALEGCPKEIQNYWKGRRWNHFRVFRMKSRPELKYPWLEISLPGGYFGLGARSIDIAGNEAELAFLLVRPLVREMRLKRMKPAFTTKGWPGELEIQSEEIWSQTLKSQSTKESENLDVADEIAVDMLATECISRGGYRPLAGLSYLRKLAVKREEPWSKWFFEHSIGLEYRMERFASLVAEALAKGKFPEGKATNPKRFATASRHWNLMP